jgi:hypothetical protein
MNLPLDDSLSNISNNNEYMNLPEDINMNENKPIKAENKHNNGEDEEVNKYSNSYTNKWDGRNKSSKYNNRYRTNYRKAVSHNIEHKKDGFTVTNVVILII